MLLKSKHLLPRAHVHASTNIFSRTWTNISQRTDGLILHELSDVVFPYIWLRDSCPSAKCIHPSSKQKLHRTADIPLDIQPEQNGVFVTSNGVDIKWTDGHISRFDKEFLARHVSSSNLARFHQDDHLTRQTWNKKAILENPNVFICYEDLYSPSTLLKALTQLYRFGIVFLTGVPHQNTPNDICELRKLAELFGELRSTLYGQTWDVINVPNSKNIAYTNLPLDLHMDLLYFEHPPKYQILHCLRNQVIGGTSVFLDALHAAQVLRTTHPTHFDVLTRVPVSFHYINDGHHLHHDHYTIELAPTTTCPPAGLPPINHVNYSPPFQAPLPVKTPPEFYEAMAEFTRIIDDPAHTYEYTLSEGDAVLFDNRRTLHARTAFQNRPEPVLGDGEPNRWLKGCYLEGDAILDKIRVLTKAKNLQPWR